MTQHDQLIAAGWAYDAGRDAYQQPKTERWLDPRSAWATHQAEGRATAKAEKAADDPRRSKPQ